MSEQERVPPTHRVEVPGVFEDSLEDGGVRVEPVETDVPSGGGHSLPGVLVAGRAVEIRGEQAALVAEILEDWISNQYRRVTFLRTQLGSGANLRETREQIDRVMGRVSMVNRILQAWEGVLAVPVREPIPGDPEN